MPTADSLLQQAWKIHQQGQVQKAEEVYRHVLKQLPQLANAWCFLGIALHDQHRYQEAVDAYDKSLAIQPEFPIALNNRGNTLRYLYRAEEADASFLKAIALKPDYVNAFKNRGTLHVWNGDHQLGLKCYQDAMALAPADAEIHRNLGVLYLLQGRFEEGWREYRWRWMAPEMPRPRFSQPLWQGEPLEGKRILVYAEQGLGDTLHFFRYAKVLKEKGAKVIVHGPASLTAMLGKHPTIDAWIPQTLPVEVPFDYHCSFLDVADVLKTDLTNILADVPYIQPAKYLVEYWREWFRKFPERGTRIGLVWQGNRDHQADAFRSFPLATYEPLSHLPNVRLFNLQFGYGKEQLAKWKGAIPIHTFPDSVDQSSGAFMDTSAIIANLDYVVTSDTSMAHLCGALGKPVKVLLGLIPDWRWLLDRSDSVWYPTMELYRQKTQGDWSGPMNQIVQSLSPSQS